jgi:uncharacterized Zn finger protein
MAKETLPRLTEAKVRQLASAQSFDRGQSYYSHESILEPVRQGMTLRAQCEGSAYEPYDVSATLNRQGVATMACTCPYDWGGACKHIVALLLAYIHDPQAFRVIPPLETLLATCGRETLIAMIDEMVQREPGLMSVVELAAATPASPPEPDKSDQPIDVSAHRHQARRAMQSANPHRIESELQGLCRAAARLAESGDWLSAGAVYHVALDEAVQGYDDLAQSMDEDGDIAIVIDELAQGLSACLQQRQADRQTRQQWLEGLLEAELTDIELGGVDLAPSAREAVLEYASEAEWEWLEERVRTAILKASDWGQSVLVKFLAEARERGGHANDVNDLIRELGTPEQQAYLLIQEGQIEAARAQIDPIVVGKPGLVIQFADALLEAGAPQEAVALVVENDSGHRRNQEWLAKYDRTHGAPQEAAAAQQRVFLSAPSVEAFKTLRQVSRKAGNWEAVRIDVFNALQAQKQVGALVEIALCEGDVARALELLPEVRGGWRDYKSDVAQAAEKDYPQEAIALYQELAEAAIARRSRGSYQQAAAHLKRAKQLYGRLGAKTDWETYFQALRQRHQTLRALQDELQQARL